MASKGNHPQMALIQVSELLSFAQIYIFIYIYIYLLVLSREWMGCWGLLGLLLIVIVDYSRKFPTKHIYVPGTLNLEIDVCRE